MYRIRQEKGTPSILALVQATFGISVGRFPGGSVTQHFVFIAAWTTPVHWLGAEHQNSCVLLATTLVCVALDFRSPMKSTGIEFRR
jgi:hypothetical protein